METIKIIDKGDVIAEVDNKNLFFVHSKCYNQKIEKTQRFTVCGLREGFVIKIGVTICRSDEQFVRSIGRNEAAKKALNSIWTMPVLDDDPKPLREMLYGVADVIKNNFNKFKRVLNREVVAFTVQQ